MKLKKNKAEKKMLNISSKTKVQNNFCYKHYILFDICWSILENGECLNSRYVNKYLY